MNRYMEHVEVKQRKLSGVRLEEYINLVQSDLKENIGIRIDAKHNGIIITASSIRELVDNPKVPDSLRNLSICIWQPERYREASEIKKSINFTIDSILGTNLIVEGINDTWVFGMKESIRRFFDDRTDKTSVWHTIDLFLRQKITLSFILGTWLVYAHQIFMMGNTVNSILFSIASSYLLTSYFNWVTWGSAGMYLVIFRNKKREVFGMAPREYIPIIISILTLLATGIQLALNLLH